MGMQAFLVVVHVLAAMGLFAAIGIEAVALGRLRRAERVAEVRPWLGLYETSFRLGGVSMLVILVSGIWVAATVWGHQAWLAAAFIGAVAMGAMAGAVTSRRVRRLRRAIAGEAGPEVSGALRVLLAARPLAFSLRFRVALVVGVVGLMTSKPDALGSTVLLGAAAVVGIVAGMFPASGGARDRVVEGTSAS
jgi:hypothetical protein